MAFTIVTQGTFASTGVGVKVNLPSSADYFVVKNITQLATTQSTGRGVQFEWYNGITPADGAVEWLKTNSSNALNMNAITSGGFTYVQSQPQPEAAVTGTAITAANPAVVTMTNTYSEGDRVRLYGTTGMLQIAGMDFTATSVSGSSFTLLGLDASGFAAPATAVTARRIPKLDAVEPEFLYITKISQATQAVVTVTQAHNYVVGQLIHFAIPASMGMQEINNLTGKITAVGTYTMTVDINSSSFSAFAFPASTASPNAGLFATLAPAGQRTQFDPNTNIQTGYNFNYAPFHSGNFIPYMFLAAGAQSPAGSSGDTIVWQAFKMET